MLFRLRARRAVCLVVLQILAGPHFCRSFLNSSRPAGLGILRAGFPARNDGQNTRMAPILSAVVLTADPDESSDDECDGDASGSPEAASKWLRKAFVHQKSEGSVDTIASFLGSLDAVVLAKAVGQGNQNGKAALHFASQLRGDDVELVEVLLDAGADVNAATRRGHTPLVFAAGRGHSKIVQLLLRRGANPRVIVVTGDTPLSMGRARLDAETFALLEAAEKSFDGPWEDSRNASDALQAQAEHMKTCPHWRRKLQQKEAAAEEAQREQLSADLAARISKILAGALNRTEFVTVVAETCGTRRGRSILDDALQKAIGASLRTGSVTLVGLLQLLDEEALGRALHHIGHHDRRPLRTILSALLKELATSPYWLDTIAVTDITAAASLHLAMEVIRLKTRFTFEDRLAVEKLWEGLQAWARLSNSYTPRGLPRSWHVAVQKAGGSSGHRAVATLAMGMQHASSDTHVGSDDGERCRRGFPKAEIKSPTRCRQRLRHDAGLGSGTAQWEWQDRHDGLESRLQRLRQSCGEVLFGPCFGVHSISSA